MHDICHRCQAELPSHQRPTGSDNERPLFCANCGAPQMRLPEYMRSADEDGLALQGEPGTTGSVPPPAPSMVEWLPAAQAAAPVAAITGVFALVALRLPVFSFLNVLFILGGSGIALALYRRRCPLARIDGRVGLRLGVLTGMFMIAVMGFSLAAAGIAVRFGIHGMGEFDRSLTEQLTTAQNQLQERMRDQGQPEDLQHRAAVYMNSQEARAGVVLTYLATLSGIILLLTSLSGAFSGMLQTRRRAIRQRE